MQEGVSTPGYTDHGDVNPATCLISGTTDVSGTRQATRRVPWEIPLTVPDAV